MKTITVDKAIENLVNQAVKYPFPVRIAAWFVRCGGNEEQWARTSTRLSHLPDPIMNDVRNAIRLIEIGHYNLAAIPSLTRGALVLEGITSIQRCEPVSAKDAARYKKIRAEIKEELPDLINRHHARMDKKNKKS